jgi:hypothetical protein
MSGWRRFVVAGVGALTLLGAGSATAAADEGGSVVTFHSMTPITGSAVNSTDRALKAGGLPWSIQVGAGEVSRNGVVEITVKGLVLAAGQATGTNPIGTFAATVSCVTASGIVNVQTKGFPATTAGDTKINTARMEDRLSLPSDCTQPEVFVGGLITLATGQVVFRFFTVSNANGPG